MLVLQIIASGQILDGNTGPKFVNVNQAWRDLNNLVYCQNDESPLPNAPNQVKMYENRSAVKKGVRLLIAESALCRDGGGLWCPRLPPKSRRPCMINPLEREIQYVGAMEE